MKFINCTPHALTVRGLGVLPPSGILPRCATVRTLSEPLSGVRIVTQSVGDVAGLPEQADGVALIVSAMVLGALKGARSDVYAPDTGPDAVRENGQIVAVLGLVS